MNGILNTCPFCCNSEIFIEYSAINVYSCKNCKLWFRNPLPTEDDIEYYYKQDYSEENIVLKSTMQSGTTPLLAERYLNKLQNELKLDFTKIRALDFGAGIGSISIVMKQKGAEVIAVEKDENARKFIQKKGIRTFSCLDSIPKVLFDLIMCVDVVEHLREPWVVLKEIYNILKPQGYIYLSTLNIKGLNAVINKDKWREFLEPTHLYFFNSFSLEKILYSAGFVENRRCKWLLNFNQFDNAIRIKNIVQYILQFFGLDGGLRYIAMKR